MIDTRAGRPSPPSIGCGAIVDAAGVAGSLEALLPANARGTNRSQVTRRAGKQKKAVTNPVCAGYRHSLRISIRRSIATNGVAARKAGIERANAPALLDPGQRFSVGPSVGMDDR